MKTDQIIPNLYICSAAEAAMKDKLLKTGITHILVTGRGLTCRFKRSFKYKKIEIMDLKSIKLKSYLLPGLQFIDSILVEQYTSNQGPKKPKSATLKVLVHCLAGASRSVSFVIAYLMLKLRLRFKPTLAYVKARRTQASPNDGFRKQLEAFEETVQKYWTAQTGDWADYDVLFLAGKLTDEAFSVAMGLPVNFVLLRKLLG